MSNKNHCLMVVRGRWGRSCFGWGWECVGFSYLFSPACLLQMQDWMCILCAFHNSMGVYNIWERERERETCTCVLSCIYALILYASTWEFVSFMAQPLVSMRKFHEPIKALSGMDKACLYFFLCTSISNSYLTLQFHVGLCAREPWECGRVWSSTITKL